MPCTTPSWSPTGKCWNRSAGNSIENERYTPSLPLALALARYFGVTVEEMFDDQGS